MPFIETDYDQKAALKRIKNNLTEIENTNAFISGVEELLKAGSKTEYEIKISCEEEDGAIKRFSSPMVVSNADVILEGVKKHKKAIANKIKDDCLKYNISLLPEEKVAIEEENQNQE